MERQQMLHDEKWALRNVTDNMQAQEKLEESKLHSQAQALGHG